MKSAIASGYQQYTITPTLTRNVSLKIPANYSKHVACFVVSHIPQGCTVHSEAVSHTFSQSLGTYQHNETSKSKVLEPCLSAPANTANNKLKQFSAPMNHVNLNITLSALSRSMPKFYLKRDFYSMGISSNSSNLITVKTSTFNTEPQIYTGEETDTIREDHLSTD